MKKVNIIKIGGNIIDNELKLKKFTQDLSVLSEPFILIHGGGKTATDLAQKLNIPQQLIEGKRITSAETLKIAVMSYAGLINKNIVALLQKNNINAIGLSGADGNLIKAKKRPINLVDFGFVGDLSNKSINTSLLKSLLNLKLTPVICAITHDKKGQLLNTNADVIAKALAASLSSEFEIQLIYCFEKNGVLRDPEDDNSVIESLDFKLFQDLKNKEIINKGMITKLENCFDALENGVHTIGIINASKIANYLNHKSNEGSRIK